MAVVGEGLRICDEAQACDVEDDDDDSGDGEGGASEAALADADADEPESVDGGDDEGEAVDAGDGGEAGQQRIVDLGVAEQIPGQAGDAGAGEFHGDPGERNQQKSGLAAEASAEGGDQGSKERMVETEIETEEDEDAGGDGFGEAAVEVHRLVDPVTVA